MSSPDPQPPAQPDPLAAAAAGPLQRGRLRRQLRRLRRLRERQLADLGTLIADAHERDGAKLEVLERRAAEAAEVDRQVRELSHAVDPHAASRVLASGVAGSCASCDTLLATDDLFCPSCGTPARRTRKRRGKPALTPPPPPLPATAQFAHADRASIPPPPPPPG